MVYSVAAVIGNAGSEPAMFSPAGYHCCVFIQGVGQ
jgi:hypothetical protein